MSVVCMYGNVRVLVHVCAVYVCLCGWAAYVCVCVNVFVLGCANMCVHMCTCVSVGAMLHEYVSVLSLLMCVHFCVLHVLTSSYICAGFCWSIYLCVHLCKPKNSDRCLPQLSFPLFKGGVFINLSSQVRLDLSTCQPTYRIHLSSPNIMVTMCVVLPNIFSGCQRLFWGYCFIYQSLYKLTHLLRPVIMSLLK